MRPLLGTLLASALMAASTSGCSSTGANGEPQGYTYASDACAKVATVAQDMTSAEAIGPLTAAQTEAEKAAAANPNYKPLHRALKYIVTFLSSQGGATVADGEPAWTKIADECSNVDQTT